MVERIPPITLLIIIVTCITSITAFNNPAVKQQLMFTPYVIKRRKDWYRFLSYGFIHSDWLHLVLNMVALYLFGDIAEVYFKGIFGHAGATLYILLYILGIVLSEVFSYFRHQDNTLYNSLGASGAVSAVIFTSILFSPLSEIGLLYFPIKMYGYIFGLLYLLYSMHMARNANDNIGHYAHFYGAVFGFIYPIVLKPELFSLFLDQISHGS